MRKMVDPFKNYFQKKFQESKSKRKSFFVGLTSCLGIFGLTVFGSSISAVAKDIPTEMLPAPSVPSEIPFGKESTPGLFGLTASLDSFVHLSAFLFGAACGLLIAKALSRLQGK